MRRDLSVVCFLATLLSLPFLGKAYHLDEPVFLAQARHVQVHPLKPYGLSYNWYGSIMPMARVNNNPPGLAYLLASALALTGGGEARMRLLFLPFDLLAAVSLYLLASRFLSRPLLPSLILIAAPSHVINGGHLLGEKFVAAFGFFGLYALVRGIEDRRRGWYWASAFFIASAMMFKYYALLLLPPAAAYALARGVGRLRVAGHAAAALLPLAVLAAIDRFSGGGALSGVWDSTASGAALLTANWAHRTRSLLAFIGGCGVVTAAWPLLQWRKCGALAAGLAAAPALALFLPTLDLAPLVRMVDRLTGMIVAAGVLLAFVFLLASCRERARGCPLWAPWILGFVLLQSLVYWTVTSRLILFIIPPLVLALAEGLEFRRSHGELARIYGASLAGILALSLSLAWVDYRYAAEQKAFAAEIAAKYIERGRKVYFAGHWGFQHYLEQAGAQALDLSRGGWDEAGPGDVVVYSRVNSNLPRSRRPRLANVIKKSIECPLPLRLISGWTGEGGFFSNETGFLPYSLSAEPLEEFTIVELL